MMKELIAVILILMLFSSAKGETTVKYFNTDGVDAQYSEAVQDGEIYKVGKDLQEGMYGFTAGDGAAGKLIITNWDGSIDFQQEVSPGFSEVKRLYNEQTVYLPTGCKAEFYMNFLSSEYDTGTRGLQITEPGTYYAGKALTKGLYIVQNCSDSEPAEVCVLDAHNNVKHQWNLVPDARYTIWLDDGCGVKIGEGCLLRSMTTQWLFQVDNNAMVAQGRFSTRMQIPGRVYTVTGRDYTSCVAVTSLKDGQTTRQFLVAGQTWTLNTRDIYEEEWLVEMVNVEISWENGLG